VDNIHRIADLLKGAIVKPGDTFSVNDFVGPRDAKHGFKPAPTIEEGEMVDSPGGGISQFATTMFNALYVAGYDIVERSPHTYYFSRYPMGRDATLSFPKPDLSFKNDTKSAALLWTEYTDTSITVKVFGDHAGRKVSVKVSPQEDVEQPPVEYIPDMTQAPDKETVKEPGQVGWSVRVTREIRFPDGTKKDENRKVTYKPRVRRVVVHPCKVPEGAAGHTGEKCPDLDGGVADGGT
jgi:vancomycin resistance protein YoaR